MDGARHGVTPEMVVNKVRQVAWSGDGDRQPEGLPPHAVSLNRNKRACIAKVGLFIQRLQPGSANPWAAAFSLQLILLLGGFFLPLARLAMLKPVPSTTSIRCGPAWCRANRSERALPGGGCEQQAGDKLNLQTHRCRQVGCLYGLC